MLPGVWVLSKDMKVSVAKSELNLYISPLILLSSAPSSQVAIGCRYKWIIDMFNGVRDLIDANNQKEELLDNGADIDNKDMFDVK